MYTFPFCFLMSMTVCVLCSLLQARVLCKESYLVVYEFFVLSLGFNVNTRVGVSQPDMGSIFQIKVVEKLLHFKIFFLIPYPPSKCFHTLLRRSKFSIVPPFSNTERTLMHLLLFTNSAQRELVSICTQSTHNRS